MDCKYCQEFQSNMSCLIQQITRGVDPCDFALFTVNNDYQARYRKGGGVPFLGFNVAYIPNLGLLVCLEVA